MKSWASGAWSIGCICSLIRDPTNNGGIDSFPKTNTPITTITIGKNMYTFEPACPTYDRYNALDINAKDMYTKIIKEYSFNLELVVIL